MLPILESGREEIVSKWKRREHESVLFAIPKYAGR